jgi:hypothetical protein
MHKFGVFTTLMLSWITASCAERTVNLAVIPRPTQPKAASKPWPNNVEARYRVETLAEDAKKRSSVHSRQVTPSASVKPERSLKPQAPLPQVLQQPEKILISHEPSAIVALPLPPEPAAPNFPITALMPPPPEPVEQAFPSTPPAVELTPPPEPPTSTLPEVTAEATVPSPPDPVETSLPLRSQEQIAAESPILSPYPDLPSYLSLRPRFEWVDTVGAIELPQSPLSGDPEASPEKLTPSLIRTPWPLSMDGS